MIAIVVLPVVLLMLAIIVDCWPVREPVDLGYDIIAADLDELYAAPAFGERS